MEYILIDENNIIIEMFHTDNIEKIKKLPEYKQGYRIEKKQPYHEKGLNLNRVVNNEVLSNREAIKRGLIKLKENEVLINDNIIELDKTQKIVNNEIVEKNLEEKLKDNLITKEEYNNHMDSLRRLEYERLTDPLVLEAMKKLLLSDQTQFKNKRSSNSLISLLNETVENIKKEYKKV